MNQNINILDHIQPKTIKEQEIINYSPFIEGVMHGKPRKGHPEGKVLFHIKEVLINIDSFYLNDVNYLDLRIIALLHDTFKNEVDRSQPKTGENHHATIAAKHAKELGIKEDIIKIIKLHDEAFNAWQQYDKGKTKKANDRIDKLINELDFCGCVDLYQKFCECDNKTGNKSQDNYEWFLDKVAENFS